MPWDVPADPDLLERASAWFLKRAAVTKAEYEKLEQDARDQSFTIGGTVQLRVVQTILDETRKGVAVGDTDFEGFKERLRQRLKSGYVDKNSARLRAMFSTTTQMAYSAGRWEQLNQPEQVEQFPYLLHESVLDKGTTLTCRKLNGCVLRRDHPHWLTHWPPLHVGCRSQPRGLTAREARQRGIWFFVPTVTVAAGFGVAPGERTDDWEPDPNDFHPSAFATYRRKLAGMRAASASAQRIQQRRSQ